MFFRPSWLEPLNLWKFKLLIVKKNLYLFLNLVWLLVVLIQIPIDLTINCSAGVALFKQFSWVRNICLLLNWRITGNTFLHSKTKLVALNSNQISVHFFIWCHLYQRYLIRYWPRFVIEACNFINSVTLVYLHSTD